MGIGAKLSELLKNKNSNPNELADSIGVSASTIYSIIKRDNMKVDISILAKICKELNVKMEVFYQEYISDNKIDENLDIRKQRITNNFDLMNEQGKNMLLDYSEFLIGNEKYIEIEQKEKHA